MLEPQSTSSSADFRADARLRIDVPDELLAAQVRRALAATGRRQLSRIQVSVQQGVVRLEGPVGSYYAKQLAQQAVLSLAGSWKLESQLQVQPPAR